MRTLLILALLWAQPPAHAQRLRRQLGLPAFSPLQLPALTVWVDASDVAPGAVSIWPDKSGLGNHFYAVTNSPTAASSNGRNMVQFDGVNDAMTNTVPAASQATIFIAFRLNSTANATFICDGISANRCAFYRNVTDASFAFSDGTSVNTFGHNTRWNAAMLSLNGASSTWMTNATTETTFTNSPGTLSLSGLTLAARYNFAANYWGQVDIAEIIICATANIPSATKSRVMDYLRIKWGI